MPCDDSPDDVKTLWQEAGKDRPVFSPDQLRKDTERLQARRRRGNSILLVCLSIIVATFALGFFLVHNTLGRTGSILAVLAFGHWLVHILVERARTTPDLGETSALLFYRAELVRTRDFNRHLVWRWLLIPLPNILFDLGLVQTYAKRFPFFAPLEGFVSAVVLAVFLVWAPVKHLRAARRYQGRIDALDAAIKSNGEVTN
jgi:Flp pilus assembly protein TadB